MILEKMTVQNGQSVQYLLRDGDSFHDVNALIGREIQIEFSGHILCQNCQRKIRKSYSQGHCFPCSQKLASCDICIVRPERCHFDEDTCREPEWGMAHCMKDHFIYLANSSGLKVGITRATQIPTRWIDQGAIQAIKIYRAKTRHDAGLLEVVLSSFVSDKTNWRKMLQGEVVELDMVSEAQRILELAKKNVTALQSSREDDALVRLTDEKTHHFNYPVQTYPTKIVSHNLDKTPVIKGILEGIKGQYLILNTGVINIRKFTSYEVQLSYS